MKFEKILKLHFLLFIITLIFLLPSCSALAFDNAVFNIIGSLLKTESDINPAVSVALSYSSPPNGLLSPNTYYKLAAYNIISTSTPVTIRQIKFAVTGISEFEYFSIGGPNVYSVYKEDGAQVIIFDDLNIPVDTKKGSPEIAVLGRTKGLTGKAGTDNKPISLVLKSVQYSYGLNNLKSGTSKSAATSSTFYVSNAKVSVSLTPRSDDRLFNKEMNLLDLKIQAPESGPIIIKSIPLSITSVGNVILSASKSLTVKVGEKSFEKIKVSTSSLPVASKTGSTTISFIDGYTIPAGTSVIFSIYGTPENVYYHPAGNSLSIFLGDKNGFIWDDMISDNYNLTGDFISGYASNMSVLSNNYAQEQDLTVKVISPLGGEVWKTNEKKEIKWEATGGKEFSVSLLNKNTANECLVGVYPSTVRAASFNVNNTSCKGGITFGDYKAVVNNIPYNKTSKNSTTTAMSRADFKIVGPSPIKIVYPLGGELITSSQMINLRWVDSSIDPKSKISLSLLKISNSTSTITAKTVLPTAVISSGVQPVSINNIGAYDWEVKPGNGQYFLRLSCGEAIVCGVVDSKPFTIIK